MPEEKATQPRQQSGGLDRARLDELALLETSAGFGFRRELLLAFEESSARQLETIRRALAASDLASLLAAAHSLKGSGNNVGAFRLAASSAELELRARRGGAPPTTAELAALADERLRAIAALRREWSPG